MAYVEEDLGMQFAVDCMLWCVEAVSCMPACRHACTLSVSTVHIAMVSLVGCSTKTPTEGTKVSTCCML